MSRPGQRSAPWRFRWGAAAYAVLVAAAALLALVAGLIDGSGLAGVPLVVVTMPLSLAALLVADDLDGATFLLSFAAAGLVQAYVVYLLCRAADRRLAASVRG